MGKLCVVGGCSKSNQDGVVTHTFPKDAEIAKKWDAFVKMTRQDWKGHSKTSVVCSDHFVAPDDFVGWQQWKSGFKRQLDVNRGPNGAIPSILPRISRSKDGKRVSCQSPDAVASAPAKVPRRTSAIRKLEVSRILQDASRPTEQSEDADDEDDFTPAEVRCISTDAADVPTHRTTGTQLRKKVKRRTKVTQYNYKVRVRTIGTQTSDTVDLPVVAEVEDDEDVTTESDDEDSDYQPPSDSESDLDEDQMPEIVPQQPSGDNEAKFIVFQSCLEELFCTCGNGSCKAPCTVQFTTRGSVVRVDAKCTVCSYEKRWLSQPYMNKMPAGNLMMSAAILFSGCLPTQALKMLAFMGVVTISSTTYFRHQRKYLQPTVLNFWKTHQRQYMDELGNRDDPGLILAIDARSDSPGHCAKYGSLTVVEQTINKVVDIQLVQSNEVPNSTWCENEGLKRTVKFFQDDDFEIKEIISDRHMQNAKWIRDTLPNTKHFFDIWHVAKGTKKKVEGLARKRGNEMLHEWIPSITNHMYWSAGSSVDGNGALIKAKWESIVGHVQDQHQHHDNLFPVCLHPPRLELEENRQKLWLEPGSNAAVGLEKILLATRLTKAIEKLSPSHQTSGLEAFHSLILKFAPKHTAFSYLGMKTRLYLAGLHYNENADRLQLVNKAGQLQYSLRYPKFKKGGFIVRKDKVKPTYEYVPLLMKSLLEGYQAGPQALEMSGAEERRAVPPPLSASFEKPDKAEAVAAYVSRFSK